MSPLKKKVALLAPLALVLAPAAQAAFLPSSLQTTCSSKDAVLVALSAQDDASLASLRAGAPMTVPALSDVERATLQNAQLSAPELGDLRAGASDHDLLIVAVVILAVIALIIIL